MTFSCEQEMRFWHMLRSKRSLPPPEAHQTLYKFLQLLLGFLHSFLCANHSDEFLVFVFCGRENDPRSGAVTNFADVSTTFSDEELVVFRLCEQLSGETLRLLWKNNFRD